MTRKQVARAFEIIDDVRRVVANQSRAGYVVWLKAPLHQVEEVLRRRGVIEYHIRTGP